MYGFIRTDYIYESEAQIVENVPPELTREVGTLNASAGLSMDNGVSVKIWVRNLNNDEYFLSAFPPLFKAAVLTLTLTNLERLVQRYPMSFNRKCR